MHDPLTMAFEIKRPWPTKGETLSGYRYYPTLFRVWHKDPCKDGSDDSCDWFGHKKNTPKIKALGEAIWSLETILDNKPFWPDHPAHLRFQPIKDAHYALRTKSKFRWHPRWHFWHWRIQVPLWQTFYRWAFERCCICKKGFAWDESVMGNWDGDAIWHDGCNEATYKKDPK